MNILDVLHAAPGVLDVCVRLQDEAAQLEALEAEWLRGGTSDDQSLFGYCRYRKTGDLQTRFENGVPDGQREDGLGLDDFVRMEQAVTAKLTTPMVLVLRLYCTACFRSINSPLREELSHDKPHPFPVTVYLLNEALKLLRAVEAHSSSSHESMVLWRGMRNVTFDVADWKGGCERAPMSTTRDLDVAIRYSFSARSVLLKVETQNFRNRGADVQFLSSFPNEQEVLFPPLTFLRPTGREPFEVRVGEPEVAFLCVEVEPSFG